MPQHVFRLYYWGYLKYFSSLSFLVGFAAKRLGSKTDFAASLSAAYFVINLTALSSSRQFQVCSQGFRHVG
jgi:hypothetical protein